MARRSGQTGRETGKRTLLGRREAVLRRAGREGVKAVLITDVEDVAYLSGFTGDDSFLLMGRGGRSRRWACLLTDGRYGEQARRECPGIEIRVRAGRMPAAVAEALKGRSVRRLGVQPEDLTLQWRSLLEQALGGRSLAAVADLVAPLREAKDAQEVQAILRAVRAAEKAFRSLLAGGKKAFVGRTERQVAAELDYRMRLSGADRPAFETIVAAGAHASLPHYRPGDTRIGPDQPVLIDWGARLGGYCSDLTRVVFPGRVSEKMAEIYQVVLRAQLAGIAAVAPRRAGRTVDAAARKVIAEAGYGRQFIHGLGHGLGREVHERPSVSALGSTPLRPGSVVTIEPGIYLSGLGGVRIEDDVLVTARAGRKLSSLPKTLQSMILR